jgi:hopanoid biosynthesis associated RND transporter like protein HpnN
MSNSSAQPLADRLLERLADGVMRHKRQVLWIHALLSVAGILITAFGLEFRVDRSGLVGTDKHYHQNFLKLKAEFPLQDDLVVAVESEDPEKNRQFVERLGAKLARETNLLCNVFWKGDLRMLGSKALLFVPENDLRELRDTLKEFRPFLVEFSRATNLVSLFELVNQQIRTTNAENEEANRALIGALPALQNIVQQATAALPRSGMPPSPGVEALFGAGQEAQQGSYIAFNQGRLYLITANPINEAVKARAVARTRELLNETRLEVSGVNAGLTGEPVLELDEMVQSQKDSIRASLVALFLCALIFVYGYQETGRPLKATFCLLLGLIYTLAYTTLVVGHLNILTITFVPILIGLAIDFGVHLITRYEEELRHGATEESSLRRAMVHAGRGIFSGALTTSVAFLAMGFTDFKGIQEMGVICGGGLLICLAAMLTLLPVLLLRGRQNVLDHALATQPDPRARLERLWLRRPVLVSVLVVLASLWAGVQADKVRFDYNLLNMQSAGLPAVITEKKLIQSTDKSVLFGAVLADSAQEAEQLETRLLQLPSVASIDSMSQYLIEDPSTKLCLIGDIKAELKDLRFAAPDTNVVDVPELTRTLYALHGYLGLALNQIPAEEVQLSNQIVSLRASIFDLRKAALAGDRAQRVKTGEKLARYQTALLQDVGDTFEALRNQDDREGMRIQDLPGPLRDRFVGVTGKHLLQVYPKKDVWQRDNQEEFVSELRSVDAEVTGTPVQLYEYTSLLVESYKQAAWYALVAISIMVLIHFRNALALLLALVPVGVGFLWLCGVMGFTGISFNPANIMTLPLIIGIGVANGIHILNRFSEEHDASILAKSTGKAVLVSNLTTIAGFGSLILGRHQGIQSLGYVMSIGMAACMIVSLTFLPALLKLLGNAAPGKNKPSVGEAQSTLGREEPR